LDVAARLACNHIDLKRAELLITLLRAASRNLRDAATARRQALREAAAEAALEPSAAANPRTSPRAPKRVYTDEEKDFLKWTTSSTHYAPVHRPRPESITDDDIIAAINALRRLCDLKPIETEPNWNRATLSADPVHPPVTAGAVIPNTATTPNTAAVPNNAVILSVAKNPRIQPEPPQLCADSSALASRYPEASASGLSPAAQEEGASAPGVSNSRTLPTLQAACEPKHVRSPRLTTVETSHRGYVPPGGGIPVNLATHSRQLATSN
jgi:hypothetical protein